MCLLVKQTITSFLVDFGETTCESIRCKIVLRKEHYTIGSFYHPPNDNSSSTFHALSDILLNISSDYFIIGGDINLAAVK